MNPDNAEKWWNADLAGAGFSKSEIHKIQTVALQQMAVKNPGVALKLMAEFDFPPQEGDGDGSRRRWGIIAKALSGNPERTEEIITGLASEKDRQSARQALVRIAEEKERNDARKIETPEQWLANAAAVDFKAVFEYRSMLNGWSPEKLAALGEQFQSLPEEQKQRVAIVISGSIDDYHTNPPALVGDSIRYMMMHPRGVQSGNPATQNIPSLTNASRYAASLAVTEPESATAWVDSLPEGKAKLWARKNILLSWSEYDPTAADQWLKALPTTTQAEIKTLGKQPSK